MLKYSEPCFTVFKSYLLSVRKLCDREDDGDEWKRITLEQ